MDVTGYKEVIISVITFEYVCVCVCVCVCCVHILFLVFDIEKQGSWLVDDMCLRTSTAAIISSSVGDGGTGDHQNF